MTDDTLKLIRDILEALLVLSGIVVWLGVYLERERFPKKTQDRGWRLLVQGLAAETALGLLLFLLDGSLSRHQAAALAQSERTTRTVEATLFSATRALSESTSKLSKATDALSSNETAMVALDTLTANSLHGLTAISTGLLEAALPRSIDQEAQAKIVKAAEAFSKTQFDTGFSSSAPDAGNLAAQIEDALVKAGWYSLPWRQAGMHVDRSMFSRPDAGITSGVGVLIAVSPGAGVKQAQLLTSAQALSAALNNVGITSGARVATDAEQKTISTNLEAVHILVGSRPLMIQRP